MDSSKRWEIFLGAPNRRFSNGVRVTMNSRKVILLSKEAFEAIGSPAAVELRWDENTRTIGLSPCDIAATNAFPLRQKVINSSGKKHAYRLVHASPFCKHHGIGPDRTILFRDVDMDNDGTLLLELTTAINIGRRIK